MDDIQVRIAGLPVAADHWDDVLAPYDGALVGRVPRCTPTHVAQACAAAAKVLARDDFPQHRRAAVLDQAASRLAERVEHVAAALAAEAGKPLRDARAEVFRCVDVLRFSAGEARRLVGSMVAMDASEGAAGRLGFALRLPVGVVAAITPFNFPLNLVAHKLGPAIAAGCPVVLKPAEQTPVTALRLVDLLIECGLPVDWISVVTGRSDVGAALVASDVPKVVSFTGSPTVGRAIQQAGWDKKVLLELGSNAPLIVEPDSDISVVAAKVRKAGFTHAGQSCVSVQRLLVHIDLKDELVRALAEQVQTLVTGDPLDEATEVGPLINAEASDRVLRWVQEAVDGGGRLVTGGTLRDSIVLPTVVEDPPPDCSLVRGEVFGPVVTVQGYRSFDEAVALANDSVYGLQVGVFTTDLGTGLRALRELDFGGVLVNEVPSFRADQQPYGGVRDSGNTKEGPAYLVEELTHLRFALLTA